MAKVLSSDAEVDRFIESIAPDQLRDARYLRAVSDAHARLVESERALKDAVEAARNAGDSWTMIGLALGTSKQNAHRKFGTHSSE